MQYRTLGKTDIKVSQIGLGTNAVGGHNLFKNLNEDDGKALVRAALDHDVTFIDTADIYGKGRSEELIGEVLREYDRAKVIIATKGGQHWHDDGSVVADIDPVYLRSAVDASLKRLQTDYIDLYYIHFPDDKTSLEVAVAELARLKQAGKIRAIGVSNLSLAQLKQANLNNDISTLQVQYSMLGRGIEADVLPYCLEHHISVVPYGPLQFGLLSGRFHKETELDSDDWRQTGPLFQPGIYQKVVEVLEQLTTFASGKGTSLPQLALAWLLVQPGIVSVIPGGRTPERIIDNIGALNVGLSSDDIVKLEDILKHVPSTTD
jgi:myo-inositol catabolism protein IolS